MPGSAGRVCQNKCWGLSNNTVVGYNGLVNDFKQAAQSGCESGPFRHLTDLPLDFAADVQKQPIARSLGAARVSAVEHPHSR